MTAVETGSGDENPPSHRQSYLRPRLLGIRNNSPQTNCEWSRTDGICSGQGNTQASPLKYHQPGRSSHTRSALSPFTRNFPEIHDSMLPLSVNNGRLVCGRESAFQCLSYTDAAVCGAPDGSTACEVLQVSPRHARPVRLRASILTPKKSYQSTLI
ncbi:hypothetical protein WN51_09892 [Melipona quadrifasciata]|uniref:Uncharacterized protein n=1 Tax=Melipona quadrifasciata TaxID=166423 RepID=A0A0N0U6X2_9HYME|nr:hypothetical protein WN51_09892 [Melipona quadrifasciata]